MSIYNVILDKEQIDVLKCSCIKNMLDNTRKMDNILLRHLRSDDYNLLEDKQYIKNLSRTRYSKSAFRILRRGK